MSAPSPKPPKPAKAFWGRFAIGHFAAYPVSFLTAAASLPYAMILRRAELLNPKQVGAKTKLVADAARDLKLSAVEAAQVELVLGWAMWASLAVFVLMHLATLPWAFGAARAARHPGEDAAAKRGTRIFAGTTATTIVLVALLGTGGWIWVLTR